MSVYTVITETELKQFLTTYDLGELVAFEGISAGIENTNYFVDTSKGRFVLTIFEHHSADELKYFMNIMAFMAEHNIPAAHPAATLSGDYITELKGKPASLVARLQGSGVDSPSEKQCEVIGENLAKFHLASLTFDEHRANDRGLDWMSQTLDIIADHIDGQEKEIISKEITYLSGFEFDKLPAGVIHADLFCDNALFDGNELTGIIDLYYACNFAFLFDLAVLVNEWARKPDHLLDEQKVEKMLNAYQSVRPLTQSEINSWNAAQRLGALRFWLSRLKDKALPREGEMTQIKDPNVFKTLLISLQVE